MGSDGKNEVKSTQVLQRVGELPSKSTEACGDDKSSANDEHKGVGALSITGAPGLLNSLDTFVTGYETPPSGYATPPEDFDEDQISDALSRTLAGIEAYQLGAGQPAGKEEAGASSTSADDSDSRSTDGPQEVKLKWMWADAGFSSKLAQANPFRWSSAMSPTDLQNNILKQSKSRPLLITILGQKSKIRFPDIASAAAWIDETTAELAAGIQRYVTNCDASVKNNNTHDRGGRDGRAGCEQKHRCCRLAGAATRPPGGKRWRKQDVGGVDGDMALCGACLLRLFYAAARQDVVAAEEYLCCQRLRSPHLTAAASGEGERETGG